MAKVFVNDINEYPSNVIAEVFATSPIGAAKIVDDEEDEDEDAEPSDETYTVCGTIWEDRPDVFDDQDTFAPPKEATVIKKSAPDNLFKVLLEQDVIIYSITDSERQAEEAEQAITMLVEKIDEIPARKKITFICLSSCLGWAKTRPADADEPDAALTEDEFRRRKPHYNYKKQNDLEKLITKSGKTNSKKLSTYVVTAGLIYGKGERVFHKLFKDAWQGASTLNTIGPGEGSLPTVHITDLCSILRNITENQIKTRYIIAADDSENTQGEIVRAISEALGTGKVGSSTMPSALGNPLLTQADMDQLTINLRLEGTCIKEHMNIEWAYESGLVANMKSVVDEYRAARNLIPIRISVLGPPGVGKSTVAQRLGQDYTIQHLHMKRVIDDTFAQLDASIARMTEGDENEDEDRAQEDSTFKTEIMEAQEENGGRILGEHITALWKRSMSMPPCRNQGFIMDGYCKTTDQAKTLFAPVEEEEDAEEESPAEFNKDLMPDVVIILAARNVFLTERIINLPEEEKAKSTHFSQEKFGKKLDAYRRLNTEDATIANYFDELEVHPVIINVEDAPTLEAMEPLYNKLRKIIGPPRNYGLKAEERQTKVQATKDAEEIRRKTEAEETAKQAAKDAAVLDASKSRWTAKYVELKVQEEEMLAEKEAPMRDYLMKHVMPTLTQGMVECMRARPEDPIDFLAEFLFRNNPAPEPS